MTTSHKDTTTIKSIAQECFELSKGNTQKGAKLMENQIRKSERLFHLLMDPLVEMACSTAINEICRSNRHSIWVAPNYTEGGNGHRIEALATSNLMAFPLPGGKPLGKANKMDILEAADFYRLQGKDMLIKSQWLNLIANKLVKSQIVEKVLTEEQLAQFKVEATNE